MYIVQLYMLWKILLKTNTVKLQFNEILRTMPKVHIIQKISKSGIICAKVRWESELETKFIKCRTSENYKFTKPMFYCRTIWFKHLNCSVKNKPLIKNIFWFALSGFRSHLQYSSLGANFEKGLIFSFYCLPVNQGLPFLKVGHGPGVSEMFGDRSMLVNRLMVIGPLLQCRAFFGATFFMSRAIELR